MKSIRLSTGALGALSLLCAHSTPAYFTQFGEDWSLNWLNRVTVGANWRAQDPDPDLIAKSSLNPDLCAADDCIAVQADNTAPNDRYLAAPGAMFAAFDDANMNYKQGDVVSAVMKWTSRFSLGTPDYGIEAGALYFFDGVNTDFMETKFNQITEAGAQPGQRVRVKRDRVTERDIGNNLQILETNAYVRIPSWTDLPIEIRVGRQNMFWGEAALTVQGSVNVANPPDANALTRPGFVFDEIYRPVNMVTLKSPIYGGLNLEAFYALEWRPYGLPAKGSFFSFFDAGNEVAPNEGIALPFGKAPDDPLQLGVPADPIVGLVSSTSFTALRGPNREPRDNGEYGVSLNWLIDELSGSPVVLSAFYANYHSRLPNVSANATAATCARREGNANNRDTATTDEFFEDCELQLSPDSLFAILGNTTGVTPRGRVTGREPLPLDTASYFLDYAEDIELYGLSFNAVAFDLAIQGEIAYRRNQPVQVDIEDVLFAAFQPAFPRNSVEIGVVPGVPIATLASSRVAVPDYLTAYRGGTPGEIVPGAYVRGYERLETWHPTLAFSKVTGASDLFGATEGLYLLEFSADYVPDLPDLDVLQFEGPGTTTHYSPGIFETGNALVINPIQNREGYVTKMSWGYRAAVLLRYADVFTPGLAVRPLLIFTHDVKGTGPGLAENFLEGRKVIVPNLQFQYKDWRLDVIYATFRDGGRFNTLRDRATYALELRYEF